jgi:hypothetical protein
MVATIKAAKVGPSTSVLKASVEEVGIEKVAICVVESRYPKVTPIPEPMSDMYDPSKRIRKSLVSTITTSGEIGKGPATRGVAKAALES